MASVSHSHGLIHLGLDVHRAARIAADRILRLMAKGAYNPSEIEPRCCRVPLFSVIVRRFLISGLTADPVKGNYSQGFRLGSPPKTGTSRAGLPKAPSGAP